jgi:hypothetical protein
MTTEERKLIGRALGANTLSAMDQVTANPDPDSWTGLAVAVTFAVFREIQYSPPIAAIVQALWVKAGYAPPPARLACDAWVAAPCFSFAEVWTKAAQHLARTGRARQAETALRSGVTVRGLLRAIYGVKAGPEWDPATERRAFLRTLRRAKQAESN